MADHLNTAIFGIYPYIALAVLALGSIVRYDREPYTGARARASCCGGASSCSARCCSMSAS